MNTEPLALMEVENKIPFINQHELKKHALKHVFKMRQEQWWKLLGDEIVANARAEMVEGKSEAEFWRAAYAYQDHLADQLVTICRSGQGHCHSIEFEWNENWEKEICAQWVHAWPVEERLFICARAGSRPNRGFLSYRLITGYRAWPRISRELFVDISWGKATDRGALRDVVAVHDSGGINDDRN
jgi:hypothetical protein